MTNTKVRLLLFMLACMWSAVLLAQTKSTINGVVRDATGVPVVGATVKVKGSNITGVTDETGHFTLKAASGATLTISSIGFVTKDVTVGNSSALSVDLVANNKELSEVVVTGFGQKQQTRKLAYAITEVKGEEISRAGTVNVVNSLQGKVAGVMINQGAGGPSSSSRIRIRGNSSLSGNTMPLFVIDGVLIQPTSSGADSWGDNRDFGNQLKNLNPDDYESLTVLKGSAASALYGSQAINGVVLITTKKGRSRPGLGVTVNQTTTWNKVYRLPDFQNEYGGGASTKWNQLNGKDAILNDDYSPYYSFGPKFDGREFIDADGVTRKFVGNDMKKLYQTGMINNTNVAVEGGNDRTTVRFSYTRTHEQGIVSSNSFHRDNFNLHANQKIGNFLTMDASIAYAVSNSLNPMQQGGQGSLLYRLAYSNARQFPIQNLFDNYIDKVNGGRVNKGPYLRGSVTDDMWTIYQTNVNQKESNLLANLDMTATITPWLRLLLRGNINSISTEQQYKERGDGPGFASATYGAYRLYNADQKTGRLQALLSANKDFGKDLSLSASIGGETQRGLGGSRLFAQTNGGFKVADIYSLTNSKQPVTINNDQSGKYPQSRLDAVYAYGDITWREMLTLTASIRRDQNSTLTYPDGHGRYAYNYPSVGVSWIFSEMLKNNPRYDFLSFGKLRASYGETGAGTAIYTTSAGNYAQLGTFTDLTGLVNRYGFPNYDLGNLDLKPLKAKEFEFGADLRFFDNRIRVDAAFYKKNTYNEVINLGAPAESGISSRVINAGNIQNKGVELLVSVMPVKKKDIEWTSTFNFTRNRNMVVSLYNGQNVKQLDIAFGADVESVGKEGGQFGTIRSTYAYARDPKTNAKLLRQDGTYWRSGDYGQGTKELGTIMENFLLSNINEVRYKNFTLFVQVDSKVGGKIASPTHAYGAEFGNYKSTLFGRDAAHGGVSYTDGNGQTRDDGIIPEGVFGAGTVVNGQDISGMSYADAVKAGIKKPLAALDYYEGIAGWGTGIREYSIFDNSWVALREVSIGYEMPKSITSKLKLQRLKLNVIGRNLTYLFTNTKDGIYPESIYASRPGAFAETGGGPYQRQIAVSLNASF